MGAKKIKLSSSELEAIVDEEDYPILSRYTWRESKQGRGIYPQCAIHSMGVSMHKLIMGTPPRGNYQLVVDHINNNELDNRKQNLRWVSLGANAQNKRDREHSSKYIGVRWTPHRQGKHWVSYIRRNKKSHFCGRYSTEEEAARGYDRKCVELDGDHAFVNFPDEWPNCLNHECNKHLQHQGGPE